MNSINDYFFFSRSRNGALSTQDGTKAALRHVIASDTQTFFANGGRVEICKPFEPKLLRESPRRPHPNPFQRKVSRATKNGAVSPSTMVNVSQAMEMLNLDPNQLVLRQRFMAQHRQNVARMVKVKGKTFFYFEIAYIERVAKGVCGSSEISQGVQ